MENGSKSTGSEKEERSDRRADRSIVGLAEDSTIPFIDSEDGESAR